MSTTLMTHPEPDRAPGHCRRRAVVIASSPAGPQARTNLYTSSRIHQKAKASASPGFATRSRRGLPAPCQFNRATGSRMERAGPAAIDCRRPNGSSLLPLNCSSTKLTRASGFPVGSPGGLRLASHARLGPLSVPCRAPIQHSPATAWSGRWNFAPPNYLHDFLMRRSTFCRAAVCGFGVVLAVEVLGFTIPWRTSDTLLIP